MKSKILKILIPILVILIVNSVFIVDEKEQAIITQFGKPVGITIIKAGLKFKIPFIHTVLKFDKRILEWDGAVNEIPTKDNKYILIDTFAKWKISDALEFYKSAKNELMAQSRLDDIIDGAVRDEIANRSMSEIVKSTDRVMNINDSAYSSENRDNSKEEYVDKALLLINDENLLNNMSKDILNNKHKIFETYDTIEEWNELLVKLSKDVKINIMNNYYKNNIYDLSINDDMANLIYLNNLSKIYNPLTRNILNIGDYINKFTSLFIKIYDKYNLDKLYDSLPAVMNDIINSTIIIGNGRKMLDNEKNENLGYLIQLFKKVVRINNFEIYDYKNKIDYQKYIGNKTTDWVITDMTSYEQEKLDFSELENIHRFIPLLKRKNNIIDTQYTNNPKLIDIDNKYELILKNEYYPNDENYWVSTGLITLCKLLHENNNTNNTNKIFVIGFDFFENKDFIHYYDDQIISTDHKGHLERNIFNDLKKKFNNTLIDVFN